VNHLNSLNQNIEIEIAAWADRAYAKLLPLRRACFLALDAPDAYNCDLMLYCDHILDVLQYGALAAKLAVLRAARAGELGLPGAVIMA
jgi:hypothetical protein